MIILWTFSATVKDKKQLLKSCWHVKTVKCLFVVVLLKLMFDTKWPKSHNHIVSGPFFKITIYFCVLTEKLLSRPWIVLCCWLHLFLHTLTSYPYLWFNLLGDTSGFKMSRFGPVDLPLVCFVQLDVHLKWFQSAAPVFTYSFSSFSKHLRCPTSFVAT